MDQKTIWGCCFIMGWVAIGVALVVKLPDDDAAAAFAQWTNASSQGLAISQTGTC